MFQLTRRIEYSLIMLQHLLDANKQDGTAIPNNLITVKAIAKRYGIPEMHAAKTFQILCQKGILNSKQGTKGGYSLAKPVASITLYELIEKIEGPFGIVRCTVTANDDNCNYSSFCNITHPMQKLNAKLIEFYKNTTLNQLLEPQSATAK